VSAEVFRSGYQSPVTGKTYETPVYYGAAFVDNPAVKGMPWQVVVNAADYGHTRPNSKDGEKMSWIETLKSVLRKEGVADEELAAVDQLAARPPATTQDPPAPPPAVDDATRAQVEQLLLTVKEQATALEQLRATRAQEAAEATVDKLVTTGLVPPAVRLQCLHLVQTLGATAPIELLALDAEGKQTSRKATALELLSEILQAAKPELATSPQGRLWQGEAGKPPEQLSAEEVEKAAETLLAAGK
jgi:hypothetical protein